MVFVKLLLNLKDNEKSIDNNNNNNKYIFNETTLKKNDKKYIFNALKKNYHVQVYD